MGTERTLMGTDGDRENGEGGMGTERDRWGQRERRGREEWWEEVE